jgi:hypothetical protein
MSVATTGVAQSYTGDGTTTVFEYPNYLYAVNGSPESLIAAVTVAGVTTFGTLNGGGTYDFTFSGVADIFGCFPVGGNVTFNNAPPASAGVLFTRLTPKTQTLTSPEAYPAPTAIEHAYDKLTLMAQEGAGLILGTAVALPTVAGTSYGQIWLNGNSFPGGNIGWVWCTNNEWEPFGNISLLQT